MTSQNGAVQLVSSSSSSSKSECILRARYKSRLRSQRTTQAHQKYGKMRNGRCRSSFYNMSDGENEKDGDATGKREKNTTHEPSLSSLPSWKVVSESPWISDGRSNATEQPSVEEEPKDGIPSRRRATKMIFTCNKCGTRLSLSLFRVQDFDFYHSLSFFRYARYPNRTKSKQRQLNCRDDVGPVREPVLFGVAQNSR